MTFLPLILKEDQPKTFNDYRPIALCDLVYKIVTRIIANQLRPMISMQISKEQFEFLDNRQILDAIGVAQETMHSIKSKKLKSLILKLDLVKAYSRVNWDFLRLVLLQVGLSVEATKWIMGCVTIANFVVLINGEPTRFFKSSRGLCRGCPLSPLLFLFVVEGLSRLIHKAKREGSIKGPRLTQLIRIIQLIIC